MSKAHYLAPAIPQASAKAVRLGQTNAKFLPGLDEGKFVKLTADSRYELCAAGNPIEGVVLSVDNATSAGYAVGSVYESGRMFALADGLEATPGTGTIAVGDYVVCGTPTALGTALSSFPKVCKATNQPGATVTTADNVVGNINAAIAKVVSAQANAMFAWRVVSLYTGGVGTVGATVVIERVNSATGVVA